MARIRSVSPGLRTSETAAQWDREARYAWVLLWGYLDDYGRGVDNPRVIAADCFPLDRDDPGALRRPSISALRGLATSDTSGVTDA